MNTIDFSPLYRSSVGFDRLASLLNSTLLDTNTATGYPPYNIEAVAENKYRISLAVAGFTEQELNIQVEKGVLTVKGEKAKDDKKHNYLYQGIATRTFERKFNLADHVEVKGARLLNGLLEIELLKEIPEAMKPRTIAIEGSDRVLDQKNVELTN